MKIITVSVSAPTTPNTIVIFVRIHDKNIGLNIKSEIILNNNLIINKND